MEEAQRTDRKLLAENNNNNHLDANTEYCEYPDCIIAMNKQLDKVIAVKQKQNRLEDKAKNVLESRLKASYGEVKGKVTGLKPVGQSKKSQIPRRQSA